MNRWEAEGAEEPNLARLEVLSWTVFVGLIGATIAFALFVAGHP
jgi:hypothetical protein